MAKGKQADVDFSIGFTILKAGLAKAKKTLAGIKKGITVDKERIGFTKAFHDQAKMVAGLDQQMKTVSKRRIDREKTSQLMARLRMTNSKRDLGLIKKQVAIYNKADPKKLLSGHQKLEMASKKLSKSWKTGNVEFQGWAMSIMFFGMAIQRVFMSIWKSSTKTFNDVMHSVEGTVTKFDVLTGQLTFLKFVAGEALQPLVEGLIKWTIRLRELIEKHPKLFRWMVKWGTIIGTILFLLGTLVLGFVGLIMGIIKLYGWIVLIGKKGLWAWIAKASKATWVYVKAMFAAKTGTAAFSLTAIAAWAGIIGIILLAVAVFLSLKFTWLQVYNGFKIKLLLLGNYFKLFWANIKLGLAGLKYVFASFGAYIKDKIGTVINWLGEKFHNFVKFFADKFDRIVKAGQKLGRFKGVQLFNMTDVYEPMIKLDDYELTKVNLLKTLTDDQNDLLVKKIELMDRINDLYKEATLNEISATENFKKGWSDVLDWLKGKKEDISGTLMPTGEQAVTSPIGAKLPETTIINNNQTLNLSIAPQMEGESAEDFAQRILDKINEVV